MMNNVRVFDGVTPKLGQGVYIDPSAVVIGKVELGDDVSVWPGAVIRGDIHHITIGSRSNIQDRAVLHVTHASEQFNPKGFPLNIGEEVVVGHGAILHGCTIGSSVLIGNGSVVNDGAFLESELILGAGSVVPPGKRLVSGFVYTGNPAKTLRPLKDKEKVFLKYSPMNYVKLKNQYISEALD